jgi:hypothetical protein
LRQSTSQSKIANFDLALFTYKYVGRLDIPMNYVGDMAEVDRADQVVDYQAQVLLSEFYRFLGNQELPQI